MKQLVSKAVGIDLGTTNSAVAVMNAADTEILIHRDPTSKSPTTPSCVWRNPATGETVVGRKAFIRVGRTPEPVRSIKRLMGQRATVPLSGEQVSPEEISSAILAEMKRQIEEDVAELETPSTAWVVDRAIVTVPAYFDQPQIDATRKAAELAGLEVLELLHEPTAAACHYCWRTSTRDGVFLVYDLGGGTFDVSVVRCTAGAFEVLGISGNNRLGGDDIDTAIAHHLWERLAAEGWALDLDLKNDEEDQHRFTILKLLGEGAKKALSESSEYLLRDTGRLTDKAGNPVIIETLLERPELEAVARPLIERTFPYCDEAIAQAEQKAGITLADVDQIILAGGSTHMPLVRELVRSELCSPAPADSGRPVRATCAEPVYEKVDTVVALGAAIRAAAVGGVTIHDPERAVRVSFRGTAAIGTTSTYVAGRVEALPPGLDLGGGHVRLSTSDYDDESDLSESGAFSFTGIPLQRNAENSLSFEVFDGAGALRATVGRPLTHSEEARERPVDTSDSTAITAKAILLEVTRGGRTHRKELVPALATLPTNAEHRFGHPGDTETVLFRLYQQSRQIEVIKVAVPSSTPRSTPIRLELHMDRHSFITVRGSIGEHTPFEAKVELPPDRPMPATGEVETLQRAFDETIEFLPAGPRNTATIQWEVALESFHGAVERGDQPQAVHEFEQLEEIVSRLGRHTTTLEPSKADFDGLVEDCVELNTYLATVGGQSGVPHDEQEMARFIEAQRDQGERAFRAADQKSYGEAIVQLEGYRDHLIGLYRRTRPSDPRSEAERTRSNLGIGLEEAANVRELALAMSRGDLADEAQNIERQLVDLGPAAERDPQRAQERVSHLRARLDQMKRILTARDAEEGKLPEDLSAGDAS